MKRARGEGRIFQPSYTDKATKKRRKASTWYVRYWRNGTQITEATHSTKRGDAVKLLQSRLADLRAGRPTGPEIERTTFDDLAAMVRDDYAVNGKRSAKRVGECLVHVATAFEGVKALDITGDRITAYVRGRQDEGAANATINRELAALKRGFRLGERAGRVGRRPYIAMLREDNVRRGFFERPDLDALLPHLPGCLRSVVAVAYITGWRLASEILTRQWQHVDFKAGWLRLEPGETKNGDGRMFPMTPELRGVLEEQRERTTALERERERIIPLVFHRDGEAIRTFRRSWLTACRKAGLPGRIPHDFRRSAVRNLERAGVPRSTAMAMVGHKTEAIYRRYAITDEAMLKEGAAKLAVLHDASRALAPRVASFDSASNAARN